MFVSKKNYFKYKKYYLLWKNYIQILIELINILKYADAIKMICKNKFGILLFWTFLDEIGKNFPYVSLRNGDFKKKVGMSIQEEKDFPT